MRNKGVFVYKIISVGVIFVILLSMMITTNDMKSKVIMLPFLLCSIASIAQNVCLMLNKNNLVGIFHKLFVSSFLLFWFGFLLLGSYLFIKAQNYFSLLFTLPFWLVGIYTTRRYLFNAKLKTAFKKQQSRFNFKMVVSSFLVFSVLIIGVICFVFGIRNTYQLNARTKGYLVTDGYFTDYRIYHEDEEGITYRLMYRYEVEEEDYTLTTDYGVGYIPEINSIREVKYNPNNPSEAILVGTNSSNFLIYFGAFFMLGGSVFVLAALQIKGVFDKVKIDVIGTYIGFVLLIVGIGIMLFQYGTTPSFMEVMKSMGIWIIIPILFIIVGIFQIGKCLYLAKKNGKVNKEARKR